MVSWKENSAPSGEWRSFLPETVWFFDHTVCYGAFPHFEGWLQALRQMNQSLKFFRDASLMTECGCRPNSTLYCEIGRREKSLLPNEG